jgi:hypothetical protein
MVGDEMNSDQWIICPPKQNDIYFDEVTKQYNLQYIATEDNGETVEIINNVSRKRYPLSRIVEELKTLAKYRIGQGLPVTNQRVQNG